MAKGLIGGLVTTTGDQETVGTEETTVGTEETNSEVSRETRETEDNFAMIFAMIDQEMEVTETISRKD